MTKKPIIIVALSFLLIILSGCSIEATALGKEYTAKDLQRYTRIEVYSIADQTLINTIEDKETLVQFNQNTVFAEHLTDLDTHDYISQQEAIRQKVKECEPRYVITSYKTPTAVNNDGELEKISEITVYKDTNIIMEQISPDTIKSFSIPSEHLVFYYEVSDKAMDFLISLTEDI